MPFERTGTVGEGRYSEVPGAPAISTAAVATGTVCPVCGGLFIRTRTNQSYCSQRCRFAAWDRAHPRHGVRRKFDGQTYSPAIDGQRLTTQYERVLAVMSDHDWHTLAEIVNKISYPPYDRASEAGVSARLRDARKPRFGGHTITRRRVANGGLYEYRLSEGGVK